MGRSVQENTMLKKSLLGSPVSRSQLLASLR